MKTGTIVFFVLALCSFINIFVSLDLAQKLGVAGLGFMVMAGIAFLQAVAWVLIAWMWHEVMN